MKYKLKYVEFYITNVCNLNCNNCNRFNNYHFTGHQQWSDYKEIYEQWSNRIDLDLISILGGEPTLNPSFIEWVDGIAMLWKTPDIEIVTNASRLNNIKDFYETLLKYKGRVFLGVSVHNADQKDNIIESIMNFLSDGVIVYQLHDKDVKWRKSYNNIKDESWQECNTLAEFKNLPKYIQLECADVYKSIVSTTYNTPDTENLTVFEDKNNIRVVITIADNFRKSAIINNNGVFTLHDSNPNDAFAVCYSKKCSHFVKGKLYKCGVSALLPEFFKQFNFDISIEDTKLLHSYDPLTVSSSLSVTDQFISSLRSEEAIPQCKFCPSNKHTVKFNASTDKLRVKKKRHE